jgi:RNA polymerase sigma factor (TIGR02999 family)
LSNEAPITQLLIRARAGDPVATDALWTAIYEQVRSLARAAIDREHQPVSMVATELANEAYLRLSDGSDIAFENRNHLMATIARAIRRLLVDHARKRGADKRGGDFRRVAFDELSSHCEWNAPEWIGLDQSLEALEREDSRLAKLVEMKFFLGMTLDEIADVLSISRRTVANDWAFARAFLRKRLEESS